MTTPNPNEESVSSGESTTGKINSCIAPEQEPAEETEEVDEVDGNEEDGEVNEEDGVEPGDAPCKKVYVRENHSMQVLFAMCTGLSASDEDPTGATRMLGDFHIEPYKSAKNKKKKTIFFDDDIFSCDVLVTTNVSSHRRKNRFDDND